MEGLPSSIRTGELETILVVDDTNEIRRLVAGVLADAHFRALSANSGPSGIKLAAETDERIDLLISDVDMPGCPAQTWGKL